MGWKETCKKISYLLVHFVQIVLGSIGRGAIRRVKRHYTCIQTAALESLLNTQAANRGGTYVKQSMRSVMMPFEHSKHKSAKKLLEHAEKQRMNLSLAPYRVLHSSLHNELKTQKLTSLTPSPSYKKAHRQSGKVFTQDKGAFPAHLHAFSHYEEKGEEMTPLPPARGHDPHLWQRDVSVGSIVEI